MYIVLSSRHSLLQERSYYLILYPKKLLELSLFVCPEDTFEKCLKTELCMGWVDPRVGLGWVGSGMGRKFVFLVGWVGSWF